MLPNIVVEKCKEAGIPYWVAVKAFKHIQGPLPKDDEKLIKIIGKALANVDPEYSKIFLDYHSIKVRTSQYTLELFDRSKIVRSLIKEARVSKVVAEQIAVDVERDIRRLQIKNVSSELIREMVNAKLIERRMFGAKARYTRVGIPVYDVKQIVENDPLHSKELFGKKILEDYILTRILPKDIAELHLKGLIHIHCLDSFISSPVDYTISDHFLRKGFSIDGITVGPARNPNVAFSHAARILRIGREGVGFSITIPHFNVILSPYLEGDIEQLVQTFLFELNQKRYRPLEISISMDERESEILEKDAHIGGEKVGTYADFWDKAKEFVEIFQRVFDKGDYAGKAFPSPTVGYYGDSNRVGYHTKNGFFIGGKVLTDGKGYLQEITINLLKIAVEEGNENDFFRVLERLMEIGARIFELKESYYKKFGGMVERLCPNDNPWYNRISFYGLIDSARYFEKEPARFGRHVFRFGRKLLKDMGQRIVMGEVVDKEVMERLARINGSSSGNLFENIHSAVQLQPYLKGGAFYPAYDEKLIYWVVR